MLSTFYRAFAARRRIAVILTVGLPLVASGSEDDTSVLIADAVPTFLLENWLASVGFALAFALSIALSVLRRRLKRNERTESWGT